MSKNWKLITGVIATLAALVGILSYLKIGPVCNILVDCQPQFKFTYEGTGKPLYEVAEGLAYSDESNAAILPFSITAEVLQYSGNEYSGEMDVVIEWLDKDQNKHRELVGKWENFRSQYKTPVKVELFPNKLFEYASLPTGIRAYRWDAQNPHKGHFDIVVRYNDGTELKRETVTVVHTPWRHEALLDSAVIRLNQPVTARVKLFNLGEPAKFGVIGVVYDTTTLDVTSLTDGQSWWAERTWTSVCSVNVVTDTAIGTNEDYVASFEVPADIFKEGHTYAFGITVFKELPYLKLADSDETWDSSFERWRYRDNPIYLSIFVVK